MAANMAGDRVWVRLTPEQMEFVRKLAAASGKTPPDVLRWALVMYFERLQPTGERLQPSSSE